MYQHSNARGFLFGTWIIRRRPNIDLKRLLKQIDDKQAAEAKERLLGG
jgi:hypothetical protein